MLNFFMSATWLPSIIIRLFFFEIILLPIMLHRYGMGDDTAPLLNWLIMQIMVISFEFSEYSNMRAKADLFLRVKTIE